MSRNTNLITKPSRLSNLNRTTTSYESFQLLKEYVQPYMSPERFNAMRESIEALIVKIPISEVFQQHLPQIMQDYKELRHFDHQWPALMCLDILVHHQNEYEYEKSRLSIKSDSINRERVLCVSCQSLVCEPRDEDKVNTSEGTSAPSGSPPSAPNEGIIFAECCIKCGHRPDIPFSHSKALLQTFDGMLELAYSAGLLHDRHLEILVYSLSERTRADFFESLVLTGHFDTVQLACIQSRLTTNGKLILKIPKPSIEEYKGLKSWSQADDFLWPKLSMSRHRYTITVQTLKHVYCNLTGTSAKISLDDFGEGVREEFKSQVCKRLPWIYRYEDLWVLDLLEERLLDQNADDSCYQEYLIAKDKQDADTLCARSYFCSRHLHAFPGLMDSVPTEVNESLRAVGLDDLTPAAIAWGLRSKEDVDAVRSLNWSQANHLIRLNHVKMTEFQSFLLKLVFCSAD